MSFIYPPFFGVQTWPTAFMPGIAQRLVAALPGFSRDRVFRSVWDDDWHLEFPPADRFITLFQPDFPVDQTCVTGGGELDTAFDSKLITTVFCRVEADPEGRSHQLIEDKAAGVDVLIQQVLTALQAWPGPTDATTGMGLFRRPMRVSPGFSINRRKSKGGGRWVVAPITWEVSFVADLGSPYPTNP